MNPAKTSAKTSAKPVVDPDKWLRLKLITSLGGDVVRAQVALEFVHGNPEASERYRRFKEWEQQNYLQRQASRQSDNDTPSARPER